MRSDSENDEYYTPLTSYRGTDVSHNTQPVDVNVEPLEDVVNDAVNVENDAVNVENDHDTVSQLVDAEEEIMRRPTKSSFTSKTVGNEYASTSLYTDHYDYLHSRTSEFTPDALKLDNPRYGRYLHPVFDFDLYNAEATKQKRPSVKSVKRVATGLRKVKAVVKNNPVRWSKCCFLFYGTFFGFLFGVIATCTAWFLFDKMAGNRIVCEVALVAKGTDYVATMAPT